MRTTFNGFFIVFSLVFIFVLAGCQSQETAETPTQRAERAAESSSQQTESAAEAVTDQIERAGDFMDDAAITARIKAEILRDPLLNVLDIEVTTTNGVVKLSGTVDSQQSIDRAIATARSFEQVKSVDNALVY